MTSPTTEAQPKVKRIDSLWTFIVATAVLGPFALPLLWRNPRFKVSTKLIASVAILVFTYFLLKFSKDYVESQWDQMQQILEMAREQARQPP